jgi:capsular exopolysaccharide synthesis family protein
MDDSSGDWGEGPSLRDYLAVVRRRWILIAAGLLVVPALAVLFSRAQTPLYDSRAEVLISQQSLASSLTGTTNTASQPADRYAQTQARLARVPTVMRRALADVGPRARMSVRDFVDRSSVEVQENSDLLEFRVSHGRPRAAVGLVIAYARAFTDYRKSLDTASLEGARREVATRLAALRRSGRARGVLYQSLLDKQQQLVTVEALQTPSATVVRVPSNAAKTQPRPLRNVALGLAAGFLLGVALAFLAEALDNRVRTFEEVGERLGLPLLGRLEKPSSKMSKRGQLAMLADPSGVQAEAFRMVRMSIELANRQARAQALLVTSGLDREGKTTTAANLAVAFARAGRDVTLVDLDLHQSAIAPLFGLEGRVGLTDCVIDDIPLERALVQIPLTPDAGILTGTADSRREARLEVLTTGTPPPDPAEFVGTREVGEILLQLRRRDRLVLIDGPPLLQASDGVALSTKVDGIILIVQPGLHRRASLADLRRILEASPARVLGYVATGTRHGELAYGYSVYPKATKQSKPERRPVSERRESAAEQLGGG